MLKKALLNLTFLSLLTFCIQAQIIESTDIQEVLKHVDGHPKNCLVIFDIDNTLAEPEDDNSLASDQAFYALMKRYKDEGFNEQEALSVVLPIYFKAQEESSLKLVDPNSLEMISSLKKRGHKLLVLTARSLPLINKTIDQLNKLQVNFSDSGLFSQEVKDQVDAPFVYKEGIIFCGTNSKGKVLTTLLQKAGYKPAKVIFVDDKKKNLEGVEKELESIDIEFVGIRYSYLDEKVANFTLPTLQN